MKLKKKTKVLITGAGGMLGEAVYLGLKNKATILATSQTAREPFLTKLDIRDHKQLKKIMTSFKPDLIFHLAAITDLEYCEKNPDIAWEVNVTATEFIAAFCRKHAIPMVYISTGIIFHGTKQAYSETDIPNPLGMYAKSKYAGEQAVARLVPIHFIFRAGWMMGGGPYKDKKFVNKIMKQIQLGEKKLFAVDDKFGSLTYTIDFVKNMLAVIESDVGGIYHVVADVICSRYEIAKEIVKILKRKDIIVSRILSNSYKDKKIYFAARPLSEGLIPLKLKKMNLYVMRDWKLALKEYLQRWE